MSKARCVDNEGYGAFLTVGKVYEVMVDAKGVFYAISDNGDFVSALPFHFQLLPDEPKAEWMRVSEGSYINMVTGIGVDLLPYTGEKGNYIYPHLWSIHDFESYKAIGKEEYDAFAALVGYTWKEG